MRSTRPASGAEGAGRRPAGLTSPRTRQAAFAVACWVWSATCGVLLAACAALGATMVSPGAAVVTAVLSALVGSGAAAALDAGGVTRSAPLVGLARCAGSGAVMGTLLHLCSAALGPVLGAALLAAVVTCPWVLRSLVRFARGRPPEVDRRECGCGCRGPVSAEELAGVLGVLDDTELARAWRASLRRLRAAPDAETYVDVLHVRGAYLDEIERRAAGCGQTWLEPPPRDSPGTAPGDGARGER